MTRWYDDIAFLSEIKKDDVNAVNWRDTEEDSDKQRRKQAEFWVKGEISLDNILGIAVYNDIAKQKVEDLCKKHKKTIEIKVKSDFYY